MVGGGSTDWGHKNIAAPFYPWSRPLTITSSPSTHGQSRTPRHHADVQVQRVDESRSPRLLSSPELRSCSSYRRLLSFKRCAASTWAAFLASASRRSCSARRLSSSANSASSATMSAFTRALSCTAASKRRCTRSILEAIQFGHQTTSGVALAAVVRGLAHQ